MELHSVAVEKACAIRSYRWKRVLFEHALRFFNLSLLILLLLSRTSSLPSILSHSFTLLASLFNHPFYVFLLINLIIFFIFALSLQNHHFHSNTHSPLTAAAAFDSLVPASSPHKQLVQSPVPALPQTTNPTRTKTTTNGHKVSKIDCHRRVKSANFSGRIVVGGSPELNALNPGARYGGELARRLCSMEKLSKEDFNRTVEDYIARHRRMQWEEHWE